MQETKNQPTETETGNEAKTNTNSSADAATTTNTDKKTKLSQGHVTEAEVEVEADTGTDEDKLKRRLALLEAALYVSGRPLSVNELCAVLNTRSKKKAKKHAQKLIQEYAARNTALEILELKDERYVLQLKAPYTPLVRKLVNKPLLSAGPLKTLSYIAYRQPISQKKVIDVRGQHAYGHIKLLKDMNLIASDRSGRSLILRTTDYFADYFGLLHDTTQMKKELKRIFGEALKDEGQS